MMRNRRRFAVRTVAIWLAGLVGGQFGCNSGPSGWTAPGVTRIFSPSPVVDESTRRSFDRLRNSVEQDDRRG